MNDTNIVFQSSVLILQKLNKALNIKYNFTQYAMTSIYSVFLKMLYNNKEWLKDRFDFDKYFLVS